MGRSPSTFPVVQTKDLHNRGVDFEELANEHKDAVYRKMVRVCGNHADAEDALIEALLRAYKHMGDLRNAAAFRSWLGQIAQRVCWQIKQKDALTPLLQLSTLEDEGKQLAALDPPPEAMLLARQMKQQIAAAIDSLPAMYRDVYELRDVEELPAEETAERLGLTISAVKSRLHRARGMVREQLDLTLRSPMTGSPS